MSNYRVGIFLSLIFSALVTVSCAKENFSQQQELASANVTGTPTPTPGPSPQPTPGPTPPPAQGNFNIPTYNICSNALTAAAGMNLVSSAGASYQFYNVTVSSTGFSSISPTPIIPADQNPLTVQYQIENKNPHFTVDTTSLAAGSYAVALCPDPNSSGVGCSITTGAPPNPLFSEMYFYFVIWGQNIENYYASNIYVSPSTLGPVFYPITGEGVADRNPVVLDVSSNGTVSFDATLAPDGVTPVFSKQLPVNYDSVDDPGQYSTFCTGYASPLIIDVLDPVNQAHIYLSSPQNGVQFDMLNNGQAQQISWPLEPERDMFLALPNAAGEILSSQQLFGNNTVGPDGQTAANGFLALAKYDSNNDGVIDINDPIYSQLMLWSDVNHNGIVDSGELKSLSSMGIESISLNYMDVVNTDQYGNQSRERSIVNTSGASRMIFDMWFILGQ